MRRRFLWCLVVGMVVLPGCRRASTPEEAPAEAASTINLTELLAQPRSELAAQTDALVKQVQTQEKNRRDGRIRFTLMLDLRLPLVVPIWQQSKFNSKLGFSLPSYVLEDTKDTELAVHLARYGDFEAAQKLADPKDAGAMSRINALRCEKNYPLEW